MGKQTTASAQSAAEAIGPASFILRGFALPDATRLQSAIDAVAQRAPFRRMMTPGGRTMSAALTNCGTLGWFSDRRGYRYTREDPDSGLPWPAMPAVIRGLARRAAAECGFHGFDPDAALINCYEPGARLSLHQDRDESDFRWPIVSVSLGLPAVFQFGGQQRSDRPLKLDLVHGDVVVWGGVDRLRHHGVLPVKSGEHGLLGARRINLTLRRAG